MGQCETCKHWHLIPKLSAPRRGRCHKIENALDGKAMLMNDSEGVQFVTRWDFGCNLYEILPFLGPAWPVGTITEN